MRYLLFTLFLAQEALSTPAAIRRLADAPEVIADLMQIIGRLGLSCGNQFPVLKSELIKALANIAQVAAEMSTQYGIKGDYPTICHVMSQNILEKTYKESVDHHERSRGLMTFIEEHPKPEYYWPKYFIEVTEKGNDPASFFANDNLIYTANRKIAAHFSSLVDLNGAINLTALVLGSKAALGAVGINVGKFNVKDAIQAPLLTPFEKMRIRADRSSDMPSFEVNVWPVAMAYSFAKNLTVCGPELSGSGKHPGGYPWLLPGVAQVCPIALSKDAYAYWDTGMLDYLDPQAIASMGSAFNVATCLGSSAYTKSSPFSRGAVGDQKAIGAELSKLTDKLKTALSACSWPVLGTSQAIAMKTISMADPAKWNGPYCTLWGPLAPRLSTALLQNDYSFANAGLKFKLFAHEISGLQRGEDERLSLAYPWEGPSTGEDSVFKKFFSAELKWDNVAFKSLLDKFGLANLIKDHSKGFRSDDLVEFGSPKMVDASFSTAYYSKRFKDVLRELAYLSAITAASVEAGKIARDLYEQQSGTKFHDSNDQISKMDKDLSHGEELTAHSEEEAIFSEEDLCHVSAQNQGLLYGGRQNRRIDYTQNVHDLSTYRGPVWPFSPSKGNRCFGVAIKGCVKKGISAGRFKCIDKRDAVYINYKYRHVIGYRKVPNPRIFKIQHSCHEETHQDKNTHRRYVTCEDRIQELGHKNTQVKIQRPDPSKASTLVENGKTAKAVEQAAQASAWISAELARMKYSDLTGKNPISGDRRVYTVWEKISCVHSAMRETKKVNGIVSWSKYRDCRKAIQFEVYKYIQIKLLRKICDAIPGQSLGRPFQ